MRTRVLGLVATAFILASGTIGATAQDQMTPRPDQLQIQPRSTAEDQRQLEEQEEGTIGQGGMMRDGTAGPNAAGGVVGGGMMPGGMMGRGMMARGGCPPVMFRLLFALMDSDGDGTISLQEFQAAHERIFKAMDANKDGQLTDDEMLSFMHGSRKPAPQH